MVRAETEEIIVEQQEASTTALTGPQNIKNKANVVLATEKIRGAQRAEAEAEDDDTQD